MLTKDDRGAKSRGCFFHETVKGFPELARRIRGVRRATTGLQTISLSVQQTVCSHPIPCHTGPVTPFGRTIYFSESVKVTGVMKPDRASSPASLGPKASIRIACKTTRRVLGIVRTDAKLQPGSPVFDSPDGQEEFQLVGA